MEYTKDIILNVNYGQADRSKEGLMQWIMSKMMKHKVMTVIILVTIMMIALDIVLISSFINLLSNI